MTPIQSPDLVAPAVAQALGMREAGDRPIADRLVDALVDRHLLLVFDNFEPVVAARGWWVIAIPPLTLPDARRAHCRRRMPPLQVTL